MWGSNGKMPLENFYPRPPWGGRRRQSGACWPTPVYFYPRPPWGGRRADAVAPTLQSRISIHALRGEGDEFEHRSAPSCDISLHALRGEGDLAFARGRFALRISIHALRGEGDTAVVVGAQVCFNISIHALRGEGDMRSTPTRFSSSNFYPRPPWGGRPRRSE